MLIFLIFALMLSCLLAMLLGFILDKLMPTPPPPPRQPTGLDLFPEVGGPLTLGIWTLFAGVLTLLIVNSLYLNKTLPLDHLAPPYLLLGSNYLAITVVIVEVALLTYPLAAALGYFLNRAVGAFVLTGFSMGAGIICVLFNAIPGRFYALPGTVMLLAAIILIGSAGVWFFTTLLRCQPRGRLAVTALWFGYCVVWWFGYQVAGQLGLLLISLPIVCLFWMALYGLSQYILPVEQEQRLQAFRSLLTFNLGTNFPYYIIDDWKNQSNQDQRIPTPRVPGNPFGMFLAGPGIILTNSDQLAVVTDGFKFEVPAPGVSFTKIFEQIYATVDLRPQLRCDTIKAETKDGIKASIFTFLPHRVGTGGKKELLEESYPYDKEAVLKAVFDHAVVEHQWRREDGQAIENLKKMPWEEVILTVAPPLMKEVIAEYDCNELYAPGNPRVDIVAQFKNKLNAAIAPLGIELVGGGISNIMVEDRIFEQRIRNWETQWEREKEFARGEAEAEAARQIEEVWRNVELELLYRLTQILDSADEVSDEVLAYKLIEAITSRVAEEEEVTEDILEKGKAVDYYLKRLMRRRSI